MALSFVIIGATCLLFALALSWLQWEWWWRLLIAVGLTAAVVVPIFRFLEPLTLSPQDAWTDMMSASPLHELILFVCLLIGMSARVLSLAIEQHGRARNEVGLKINRWQFIYPLLFAVPTFGGLLSQIQAKQLSVTDVVLAFQTGFFWQTILKKPRMNR
jgi:hypothetical protein